MIKPFIVLAALGSVLGREYDIMNNLVDFDDTPYQRISLPFRQNYRDDRLMNVRSKLLKNMGKSEYEVIKHPVSLIETGEVIKSLSNIQTSLMTTISNTMTTLLNGVQSALKLLTLNLPAIVLGATMTIGICKITSICSKLGSIFSIPDPLADFSSFITPERLNMVTKFIEEAARNYGS